MSLITEAQVRSSYRLIESSRQVSFSSAADRKFWESVGRDIVRDHISGKKKTSIAEAGILYATNSRSKRLNESLQLIREESWLKSAYNAVGRAAKTAMMGIGKGIAGVAKVGGNLTGLNFIKSRNWWIFGGGGEEKDQQYRDAYVDSLNKRNEIVDKVLGKSIGDIEEKYQGAYGSASAGESAKSGKAGPQNVPDPKIFEEIIGSWCNIYAEICAGAGVKVEGYDQLEVKEGAERIPVEAANEAIASIRKILETYDRFLFDGYATSMDLRGSSDIWGNTKESFRRSLSLVEAIGLNEETGDTDKSKVGQQGRQTSTMDMLKSNLAPGIVAALGAATAATGFLVQTEWFLGLFQKITTVTEEKWVPETATEYVDETIGEVTRANGVDGVNMFAKEVAGINLGPGSSLEQVKDFFSKIGGGDWKVGLQGMTQGGEGPLGNGYPEAYERIAGFLEGKTGATKWGEAASQLGTGTHKIAGDMLQLDVGIIKKRVGKEVTKWVLKKTTKTIVTTSIVGATLAAAGPMLTVLGVSMVAAGIGLKALRMWGAENSRASYINTALQKMKDIPPREEEENKLESLQKPKLPEPRPPGSKIITVKIDDKGIFFVYPVDNVAEGNNPEEWSVDDDLFTMPGYERQGKVPLKVKNDKGEMEEITGTEKLKEFCIALLTADKKSGSDVGIKDNSKIKEFKWSFFDKRSGSGSKQKEKDNEASQEIGKDNEASPGKDNKKKKKLTAPGLGSLVRVDLTTREPGGETPGGVGESKHHSLKELLFEAGEARRVGVKTDKVARKKWSSLSDEARKSTSGLSSDRKKFPIVKDKFFNTHGIDDKSGLSKKMYDDNVIRRGLSGIRRFARSGNVVLGFDKEATYALNNAGITKKMYGVLLKTYSKDPNNLPSLIDYIDALEKAGLTEPELKNIKQGALEIVLDDIGMLAKPKAKKKNKKKGNTSESYLREMVENILLEVEKEDTLDENRKNEDKIIVERWQILAGLID